jgi:hypothetical protein
MNYKDSEQLKKIAEKVLNKAGLQKEERFGSVIAILMVISIILTVIRVLQECNKNKTQDMTSNDKVSVYAQEIRSFSKKRGWFTRMRIKKIIRRELTPEEFNKYGIKLTESMLDIGEYITDDEAYTLVEAANV